MLTTATEPTAPRGQRCKHCAGRCGSIQLTAVEEIHHFGHVLAEHERDYCSQRCQRQALAGF